MRDLFAKLRTSDLKFDALNIWLKHGEPIYIGPSTISGIEVEPDELSEVLDVFFPTNEDNKTEDSRNKNIKTNIRASLLIHQKALLKPSSAVVEKK